MASRTATTSRDLYEEPFWRTPVAKMLILVGILVGGYLGIRQLERINSRHQVEARLSRHPALGPAVEKWREVIALNQKSTPGPKDQLPVALYFGKVAEFVESKPEFGLEPSRLLKLGQPQLIAGTASRLDGRESVTVSFKNHPKNSPKPKPAEEWLIAVWRDSEGKNVLHTAYRCDPP